MGVDPARDDRSDAQLRDRIEELESALVAVRVDAEVAHVLLGLSGALSEVRSVPDTLERAVRLVPELFGADRCFAATWDRGGERFLVLAHSGFDEGRLKVLQGLAASSRLPFLRIALLEELSPVLVPDLRNDDRISKEDAEEHDIGALIAVPVVRRGEALGVVEIEYDDPREFGPKDLALAYGAARQLSIAMSNARQFSLLQSLRSFGLKVGTGWRLAAVLREVAAGGASLLSGDRGRVYLVDPSNERLIAAGGDLPQAPDGAEAIDLRAAPWDRLAEGESVVVIRDGPGLLLGEDAVSIVAAPITGAGAKPLGAVLVFFDRSIELGRDETEALSVLAAQSGVAIDNAQRFEQQRRVSRSLQQGLLATETPEMEDCEVGAVYEPAGGGADIGGDFFDVFQPSDGCLGVVVGDVSGKGAEAAAQTAQAKYMLRAFAIRNSRPASALFHLNNALTKGLAEDRFATCLFGTYFPAEAKFEVAVAGHPAPLVYRAKDGTVERLEIQGGILGVFEDQNFEQISFHLQPGDSFIAYTDGLIEARAPDGELYGEDRVIGSVGRHGPASTGEKLARKVFEGAQRFGEITDDTVVLVLSCGTEAQ